jgi:hypothetical protein
MTSSEAVSLRDHLTSLIGEMDKRYTIALDAQREAVQIALTAADRAVVKAEVATEKRFESVNEFRNTLADQARDLMPRVESERMHAATHERIEAIEKSMAEQARLREGIHAGGKNTWAYIVAGVSLLLSGLTVFLNHR